ncbi:IS66 family transposase [Lacticaseibacillus manihotivorans]|uniref:IS66 family transposase n=1 Tax=Lacticaseibacillus manihotivorans TaxID=88233 RepID=UPI002286F2CF|nr:IS66 family transposase [Lacticaseibacillus manihotivorans]
MKEIKQLNAQIKLLTARIYGRRSEQMVDPNQTSLQLDEGSVFSTPEQTGQQSEETEVVKHPAKKRKRTRNETISKDLPVEEVVIDHKDKQCEHGHELTAVGTHFVREELCMVPAKFFVKRYFERTYKCTDCEKTDCEKTDCEKIDGVSHFYHGNTPKGLLAHSLVSPSLLAEILLQKYSMGTPLYRQIQQLKRGGLLVTETTIANWVIKAAKLLEPLYDLMKDHLLSQRFLQGDETPYQVLQEPGRTASQRSYIWVARSISQNNQPVVMYAYANTRSGKFAQSMYSGFTGVLQRDGYAGYNLLGALVTRVGCWAHVRRKFFADADKDKSHFQETEGLRLINEMFMLEREWKNSSASERYLMRQSKLKLVIDQFWTWCDQTESLPKCLLGKALTYAQGQRAALNRVLDYGEINLSNNASERNMKSLIIGRKNWLFSTSTDDAIWMTILETAKANGLDPRRYIQTLLENIPQLPEFAKAEELEAYLPWNLGQSELQSASA